jgi:hypothetical protein
MMFGEGQSGEAVRKTLADLILIGLDSNQQYVSAISTNRTRSAANKKSGSKLDTRAAGSCVLSGSESSAETVNGVLLTGVYVWNRDPVSSKETFENRHEEDMK